MEHHENNLLSYLNQRAYPGRGVLLGHANDGQPVLMYFIMGRSDNSRNRVFIKEETGFSIAPFDVSRVSDPSLILYRPLRKVRELVVLTNGDQTDTIADALLGGGDFESALMTRAYEPDAPHYTPRISGMMNWNTGEHRLSILKADPMAEGVCQRFFYRYEKVAGWGHLIHTYQDDGNPLPSFAGEPVAVRLPQDILGFAGEVYEALNPHNRVALYCQHGDRSVVFNRHIKKEEA